MIITTVRTVLLSEPSFVADLFVTLSTFGTSLAYYLFWFQVAVLCVAAFVWGALLVCTYTRRAFRFCWPGSSASADRGTYQ